jgi:hypothetical protein
VCRRARNLSDSSGNGIRAEISMDQVAARAFAEHTQLASLELGLDANDFAGFCDGGYSCTYTSTISWRGPTTPLPMEYNPRVVFERLFGDGGTTDAAARRARLEKNRSILDSVNAGIARLVRDLGAADRSKLQEYFEAVRDVERRIQKAEEQGDLDLPTLEQPAGIPANYEDHAKLMFDLQVLAVPGRSDARDHLHDGARTERPRLSADRRLRRAPLDLASLERSFEARAVFEDQRVSRVAVLVLRPEAAGHSRRGRVAAGSHGAALRLRDERRERTHAAQPADRPGWRRGSWWALRQSSRASRHWPTCI